MKEITRRGFIKKATVLGAAVAALPTVFIPGSARASWARKTPLHPNIDDLRVVGVTDPAMTRAVETHCPWARQEELVVGDAVWENMDRLACGLAKTRNADEAWRSIFVKPPKKSWSDAVVAVKTNNIAQQHTRSPVIAKICHTLTGTLGVRPGNIHIYDACHGNGMRRTTPFRGLPEGVRMEETWGGYDTLTAVPRPWNGNGGESECLRPLVTGEVDILINISLCKGHSRRFGGFTMTMKNHFGTFSPRPGHDSGSEDYLLAINQTPEILGPMDKRTGKVLYPRQQLCVVDAIWASKGGPGGHPTHQPNFMAMGVLSPVVDFQLATRFRGEKMGWEPNMKMARRMLQEFGYREEDLPEGGKIIEV